MKKGISIRQNQWLCNLTICCRGIFFALVFLCIVATTFPSSAFAQNDSLNLPNSPVNCLVPEAGAPSCATQTSPGSSAINFTFPQHVGNPINVITGNKYQYELDYQSVSSGLSLTRHYNSSLTAYDTGLGPGWRHTYQVVLTRVSTVQLDIVQSDGRLIHFYKDTGTTNIYRSETANDGYIETGERSIWHINDGRRMVFQGSFLVLIDLGDRLGKLKLAYRDGKLHSVTDSKGDSLAFEYINPTSVLPTYGSKNTSQPGGSIKTITLPAGELIEYRYGDHRNLLSVLYSDENTLEYKYQHEEWSSHLTNRVSTNNRRNSQWSYDSDGRAIGWRERDGINENGLNIVRSLPNSVTANDSKTTSHASVTYTDGRESQYAWHHEQQAISPDNKELELSCDNCLPDNTVLPIDIEDWEQPIQSQYEAAVESLWSSFQLVPKNDRNREGITNYTGEYPHEDGQVSIRISVDRTGKVKDFSIGDTTLSDMANPFSREKLPACSQGTHFQTPDSFLHDRIQRLGNGGEACALDSTVAVDFIYRVENSIKPDNHSATFKGTRNKTNPAVPWYDPMRRYCSLPAGMTCADLAHDLEMARMAECAYGDVSCEPEFVLADLVKLGIPVDRFTDLGFDAQLYHDANRNRYILAFRGTDDTGDDWDANLGQARGERTRQYELALNLAKDIAARVGSANLEFTGHSLGGGLATIAAIQTRGSATIFNTAALQPTTAALYGLSPAYQSADAYVRHIHTDFDPNTVLHERADDLNWGDLQTAPGVQVEVPNPDHLWMNATHANAQTFMQGFIPILWHSISGMVHVLQSLIKYNCSP